MMVPAIALAVFFLFVIRFPFVAVDAAAVMKPNVPSEREEVPGIHNLADDDPDVLDITSDEVEPDHPSAPTAISALISPILPPFKPSIKADGDNGQIVVYLARCLSNGPDDLLPALTNSIHDDDGMVFWQFPYKSGYRYHLEDLCELCTCDASGELWCMGLTLYWSWFKRFNRNPQWGGTTYPEHYQDWSAVCVKHGLCYCDPLTVPASAVEGALPPQVGAGEGSAQPAHAYDFGFCFKPTLDPYAALKTDGTVPMKTMYDMNCMYEWFSDGNLPTWTGNKDHRPVSLH